MQYLRVDSKIEIVKVFKKDIFPAWIKIFELKIAEIWHRGALIDS